MQENNRTQNFFKKAEKDLLSVQGIPLAVIFVKQLQDGTGRVSTKAIEDPFCDDINVKKVLFGYLSLWLKDLKESMKNNSKVEKK